MLGPHIPAGFVQALRVALIFLLGLLPETYGLLVEAPTHIELRVGVFMLLLHFHLAPFESCALHNVNLWSRKKSELNGKVKSSLQGVRLFLGRQTQS